MFCVVFCPLHTKVSFCTEEKINCIVYGTMVWLYDDECICKYVFIKHHVKTFCADTNTEFLKNVWCCFSVFLLLLIPR